MKQIRATVLIVGCGRMGAAFAQAWRDNYNVLVYDPAGIVPDGCENMTNLDRVPAEAVVLLAVKPQGLAEVARHLQAVLAPNATVVSIAAGITLDGLASLMGATRPIVRAMPNTAIAIRMGITAAIASPTVTAGGRAMIDELFARTGSLVWLNDEAQIDLVTAISGSGPAYFYRFAEALAAAGVARGLPSGLASELAAATLRGAGGLAAAGADLASLRHSVTSPGGTTAAALTALNDGGIEALADEAVAAAAGRAAELASILA